MHNTAYRLPGTVSPRQYDVVLDARLGSDVVRGRVRIQLEVTEPTSRIELHAVGIELQDVHVAANGVALRGTITQDPVRELAILEFSQHLSIGPAVLEIAFHRSMSNSLDGLYRAKDADGEMLTTQCEPTGARKIFPCFDEPAFKARFAYTITTSPGVTVLTNGRLQSVTESADGAAMTWTFAPTKPMSSYLVAIVIGDIASTREDTVRGVPLRVWTLRGKERMGAFGLDYTARLLPFFEEYFGTPYHFEKLDQIGVPAFAAGAMENAGLITYRQTALLIDPATASWEAEKRIAAVIAHEFAHMWFGDLVTMRWWDDLWLNEAFASWLSYYAVDRLTPQYAIWDAVQQAKDHVLEVDALISTHPIYKRVETPSDALEMFDEITYQKGCAVLRMLHSFLGEEAFKQGLQGYLREFAEGNAAGNDLWRNLQQVAHAPVTQIMESWILQGGHPIIGIEVEGAGGDTRLRLSQQRYFGSPEASRAENAQLWSVPMVVRYEDGAGVHEARYLLAERELTTPLTVAGELAWLSANAGDIGFYRVQPGQEMLARLLAHLDQVAPAEQIGLVRDQWALVQNGGQPITPFLNVLAVAVRGNDYRVLRAAAGHLGRIERSLEDTGDGGALAGFRAWMKETFSSKLATLDYVPQQGESRNDEQARVTVVEAMTHFAQDPEAVETAQQWARREAENPRSVDPNLAPVFVSANARFGDSAAFDRHAAVYRERKAAGGAPEEAQRYLEAFALFRQPELVSRTLGLIDDGTIAAQDGVPTLVRLLGQRHSQGAAWDYVKAHWQQIEEQLTFGKPNLIGATGNLPLSLRDEVVAFFETQLHGQFETSQARALEQLQQTAELEARTCDDLVAWFHQRA